MRGGRAWTHDYNNSHSQCAVLNIYTLELMKLLGFWMGQSAVKPSDTLLKTIKTIKKRCLTLSHRRARKLQDGELLNKSPRTQWHLTVRRINMLKPPQGINDASVVCLANMLLYAISHIEMFKPELRLCVTEVQTMATRLHLYQSQPKVLRLAKVAPVPETSLEAVQVAHGPMWGLWKNGPVMDLDRQAYFVAAKQYLCVLRDFILHLLSVGVTSKKVCAVLTTLDVGNVPPTPMRELEALAQTVRAPPFMPLDVCNHFKAVHRVARGLLDICEIDETLDFQPLFACIRPVQ